MFGKVRNTPQKRDDQCAQLLQQLYEAVGLDLVKGHGRGWCLRYGIGRVGASCRGTAEIVVMGPPDKIRERGRQRGRPGSLVAQDRFIVARPQSRWRKECCSACRSL